MPLELITDLVKEGFTVEFYSTAKDTVSITVKKFSDDKIYGETFLFVPELRLTQHYLSLRISNMAKAIKEKILNEQD
jgi:hypothetical protein